MPLVGRVSRGSRLLAGMVLGGLAGCAAPPVAPPPGDAGFSLPTLASEDGRPKQMVLVSVAGLGPEAYGSGAMASQLPTVTMLAQAGVEALSVDPVSPASTYPAHATLITGERPDRHGIPADHLLGDRGVRAARYGHASYLKVPTLWQRAREARLRVASFDWPSTVGAAIELLVPDVGEARRGESWFDLLDDAATPWLAARARQLAPSPPPEGSPQRDALLTTLACEVLRSSAPPHLLLLRLSQTEGALVRAGPDSDQARAAFSGADREIRRLVTCLADAGRLAETAVVVVGDRGSIAVHTRINPNVVLARAGLFPKPQRSGSEGWRAIARSNGGSAFVYARGDTEALAARSALESVSRELGAFRVVSAQEMLALGSDPEAWFGLEAMPGYVFGMQTDGNLLEPSAARGASGYLPGRPEMRPGFVAWGPGLRAGVRVPWMRQTDIAPTLAAMLGLDLGSQDGRALVGVLAVPGAPRETADGARR